MIMFRWHKCYGISVIHTYCVVFYGWINGSRMERISNSAGQKIVRISSKSMQLKYLVTPTVKNGSIFG